ncbi:hypothetical protein CPB85DRAFT_1361440 [Mucidula mucida]|nr:hypothetical protein CPB85DRAFT_1361440 [Mucidula mucida]
MGMVGMRRGPASWGHPILAFWLIRRPFLLWALGKQTVRRVRRGSAEAVAAVADCKNRHDGERGAVIAILGIPGPACPDESHDDLPGLKPLNLADLPSLSSARIQMWRIGEIITRKREINMLASISILTSEMRFRFCIKTDVFA